MNGNLISRSHTPLRTVAVLVLVQLLAVQLEARDLVWQPHAAASQSVQPRTFKALSATRLEEDTNLSGNGNNRPSVSGPAVVALQAENTEDASLEPIPVAKYQRTEKRKVQSTRGATQANYGQPIYPEGPIYSAPKPRPVVEPWHPDTLYASSGAGLKVAHRADVSVLTPEATAPEAVAPEIAWSEEILPEDLGPGEILIPDGTDPIEFGAFSDSCCPDCGGSPCGCDPDWGYPFPDCGFSLYSLSSTNARIRRLQRRCRIFSPALPIWV